MHMAFLKWTICSLRGRQSSVPVHAVRTWGSRNASATHSDHWL